MTISRYFAENIQITVKKKFQELIKIQKVKILILDINNIKIKLLSVK